MQFLNLLNEIGRSGSVSKILNSDGESFYLPSSSISLVLGALRLGSDSGDLVAVVPTVHQASELCDELSALLGSENVRHFPPWETLPLERVSPSIETMGKRLRILNELRNAKDRDPLVVVLPVRSMLQIIGRSALDAGCVNLRAGSEFKTENLVSWLSSAGYRREYQVEHRGEFALRGSIVDVYPSDGDYPVRMDFFGDEIERMARFDPSDQLSLENIDAVEIFPAREVLLNETVRQRARELAGALAYATEAWESSAEGHFFDGLESWLPWLEESPTNFGSFLGPAAKVILFDPARLKARAEELIEEEEAISSALGSTWQVPSDHDGFPGLFAQLDSVLSEVQTGVLFAATLPDPSVDFEVQVRSASVASFDPDAVTSRVSALFKEGYRIFLCSANEALSKRLAQNLNSAGVAAVAILNQQDFDDAVATGVRGVFVLPGEIEYGALFPEVKIAVIGQADISNKRRSHRVPRVRAAGRAQVFDALKVGGYVVHDHHGVARFAGMVKRNIGGSERDYLLLEYRGDDRLYVPSDQMDSITPYLGGQVPSLSRLGGTDWQKTRNRVRQAVGRVAQELVVLYQRRITARGHAFAPDTLWQGEMEDLFPYDLTLDQARAITDVKADMEADRPMDRLICGDVGFGKTEVALRAVFKAVQDSKQAAVLVPTTLLAQQHFQTFSERFSSFPVRVEVLSRFLTPAQSRSVIEGLATGAVDVVIGTHRLLGQDVKFSDLGLLVIDEEQHFGVTHKEAIKSIKAGIDVLTLTATPIPRTLEMSLTGIRDMSLLSTPPTQRQPILTYVGGYDERAVSEAVRRELLREGQVFFVHNRVADIEVVADRLSQLVPEARIAIAHGQMDEGSLEQTVFDFWEGGFDVLVCTTIIESGIDMPTVNTLVVDRSDLLGLGQLHQLRGRVGRSGSRGYAYLFHPPDISLSEEAYERLKTIGENTELGSGFRIAMRDLEIRGAGNILGGDQSGHIAAVGYDLYVKMVEEAVSELKGEATPALPEIVIEIPVGASIPEGYITRTDLRLEAYRKLSLCSTEQEVDALGREWGDRFGSIPDPTQALLRLAKIRARAIRAAITSVSVSGMGRSSLVSPAVKIMPIDLKASANMRMKRVFPGAVYKEAEKSIVVPIPKSANPFEAVEHVFDQLVDA